MGQAFAGVLGPPLTLVCAPGTNAQPACHTLRTTVCVHMIFTYSSPSQPTPDPRPPHCREREAHKGLRSLLSEAPALPPSGVLPLLEDLVVAGGDWATTVSSSGLRIHVV